jgi:UDPglucose--hexose-1-phosphate uridylyltransferase
MCPGNEHMTPPAILLYLKKGSKIQKTRDKDGKRPNNWLIRCIPNLYPAFAPPKEKTGQKRLRKDNLAAAIGHHEVIVESPNHNEHPADAKLPQLQLVISAYIDRLRELSKKPYVKYVSIFRNHNLEAGASLSHAHSQVIATPFIPRTIKEELEASRKYWHKTKECVFCNIIKKERKSPRMILDDKSFLAFAPYASICPSEFWITPKKHETSLLEMTTPEVRTFAETLKKCLAGLKTLVNDPPYNYGFHLSTNKLVKDHFHWHLEVYPKLAIWAGFELSTGMYINTVTPETAAESLRKAIPT